MASVPSPPPGLRIHGTPGKGRGRSLQAAQSFSPGTAIAVFSDPLLAIPDGPRSRFSCHWCLAPGAEKNASDAAQMPPTAVELNACTGCRYVLYCSKACQAAGWRASHKLECPAFRRVGARSGLRAGSDGGWIPTPLRAAMQLLLRLKRGDAVVRSAIGDLTGSGTETGWLEANAEGFRREGKVWGDLTTQAVAAATYSGFEKLANQPDRVTELLCKVQTNAFDRADLDAGMAGIFLDPVLAMANHSCIPNAFVRFTGRTATLWALGEIREGQEVEITYTDFTWPKKGRQDALRLYHFQCRCPRCTDDLDVYQVCQTSTLLPLNRLSLQPDIQKLRNPPIDRSQLPPGFSPSSASSSPFPEDPDGETLDDLRKTVLAARPVEGRLEELRRWWRRSCKPLVRAGMFAVEPVPTVLHDLVSMYASSTDGRRNYAYALSLACFLATECQPYAYPAPFDPWRLKSLLLAANLLTQTAPLAVLGKLRDECPDAALVACLVDCDQVTMCEALVRIVVRYGAFADRDVLAKAQEILEDLESLPGRQDESQALQTWISDPTRADANAFFEEMVLAPIKAVAAFAMEIVGGILD